MAKQLIGPAIDGAKFIWNSLEQEPYADALLTEPFDSQGKWGSSLHSAVKFKSSQGASMFAGMKAGFGLNIKASQWMRSFQIIGIIHNEAMNELRSLDRIHGGLKLNQALRVLKRHKYILWGALMDRKVGKAMQGEAPGAIDLEITVLHMRPGATFRSARQEVILGLLRPFENSILAGLTDHVRRETRWEEWLETMERLGSYDLKQQHFKTLHSGFFAKKGLT